MTSRKKVTFVAGALAVLAVVLASWIALTLRSRTGPRDDLADQSKFEVPFTQKNGKKAAREAVFPKRPEPPIRPSPTPMRNDKRKVEPVLEESVKGSISGKVVGKRILFELSPRLKRLMEEDDSEKRKEELAASTPKDFLKEEDVPLPDVKIVLKKADQILEQTTTDTEGRYRFAGLRADRYTVWADLPENAAREKEDYLGEARNVQLTTETLTGIDFQFRIDGTSITGRVTDTRGNPIQGAKILAGFYRLQEASPDGRWKDEEGRPLPRRQVAVTAVTDENGIYRVDKLPSSNVIFALRYLAGGKLERTYEVRAIAEGYIPGRITVPPFTENLLDQGFSALEFYVKTSERTVQRFRKGLPDVALPESKGDTITGVDLVLMAESRLTGRVLDAQGNAAPKFAEKASIRMLSVTSPEPDAEEPDSEEPGWVPTHDGGKFEITGIPPGVYAFEIQSPLCGYRKALNEPLEIREGEYRKDVAVFVEDTGGISGWVLDAGSGDPLEKFSVQVSLMDSRQTAPIPGQAEPIRRQAEIYESQPGAFSIENLFPGVWTMETNAPDYLSQETRVEIRSGQTSEVVLRLERAGNILGRVLDAGTKSPVETFSVKIVHFDASGESRPDLGRTTMDESQKGVFFIEGICPGIATLLIESSGYARHKAQVQVANGETNIETFHLGREAYLYGDVSLNGEPKDAQITLHTIGEKMEVWGYVHCKDARYEVKQLEEGDYMVGASFHFEGRHATTWLMHRKRIHLESGKETRLDFRLEGTAKIHGVVTWSEPAETRYQSWRYANLHPYILVLDNGLNPSLPEGERVRATAYKMEKFDDSYQISYLPAGSYTVIGMLRKLEEGKEVRVAEESKTVILEAGQIAEVNFTFP